MSNPQDADKKSDDLTLLDALNRIVWFLPADDDDADLDELLGLDEFEDEAWLLDDDDDDADLDELLGLDEFEDEVWLLDDEEDDPYLIEYQEQMTREQAEFVERWGDFADQDDDLYEDDDLVGGISWDEIPDCNCEHCRAWRDQSPDHSRDKFGPDCER